MHDTLITNGHVLTMDADFTDHPSGGIAMKDGKISAVGDVAELDAAQVIDAKGGLIIPGLINTHCHAAMTLFRGLADDRPLDQFLQTVWAAEGKHITPDTVHVGATLGAAEMALGGVTHFVDMYWHFESTLAAAADIGIGLTTGPVFIAFDGLDGQPWDKRVANAEAAIAAHPETHLMLMPHSCYTMDAEKLRGVADMAAKHNLPIHIHAAEAPSEMAQVQEIYGKRPVAVMEETGILAQTTLIAHAVHLDDQEIWLLANRSTSVAHNPLSNAKLASGTMRTYDMAQAGIPLSLGTDGPSSGNDLDMWQAMRHASFMNTNATGDAASLPARNIFAMATRDGAAAIGLADRKGTLEVGKHADIAVIDMTGLHMIPSFDPYSTLVYAAGRSDVAHVFARGVQVVADKRLTVDISETVAEVQRLRHLIA
ncbi:MAG: amidohydrolase [Pseudomonadota bacterium]